MSLPAAVLWDLDGTLIDTEPYWIACEHELVSSYGGRWTDVDATSLVGFDLLQAAEIIRSRGNVPLRPHEIVDRLLDGVIAKLRQSIPWRPGARELLAALRLRGVPCGLVTMSWKSLTDVVVPHLPPGSFQTVITGDMVMNGKPHPEPYRRAAEELRVDPLSCVAIEDSPTGIASAEAAGCVVIAVQNVVPVASAPHRVVLTTLQGITPEHLGEWVETTPPPEHFTSRDPETAGAFEDEDDRFGHEGGEGAAPRRSPDRAAAALRFTRNGGGGLAGLLAGRARIVGGVAAVLLVLAGALWYFGIRDDAKESYDPGPFRVHTWAFPSQLERSLPEIATRANAFHQLSPFWYETTGATSITVIDEPGFDPELAEQFIDEAQDRGVPVVASILDHNGKGGMAAILADPSQRQAHIDTIAAFASSNDFAGIDIDYENFAFTDGEDTWEATRPNWVAFIVGLSERLHADGRVLTVSVPPTFGDAAIEGDRDYWVYDYGSIAPHVDAIRIMAYDFTSLGSIGPIAPIDWVQRVIDGATEAAGGPERLVLGIPLYAHNTVTATTGTCPPDSEDDISQSRWRVDQLLEERNPTPPVFDPVTAETSFTYELTVEADGQSCTQTRHVQYLDDAGIRQRMQLSIDTGMLGVALFALGYEPESIWQDIDAINATLETTVPIGTTTT